MNRDLSNWKIGYVSLIIGISNLLMTGYAHRSLWNFSNSVDVDLEYIAKYLNFYDYIYKYFIPFSVLLASVLLLKKISRTKISIVGFALNFASMCWIYYILNPV